MFSTTRLELPRAERYICVMHHEGHIQRQLALLAEHVEATKDRVLDDWRERVCADPALSIASRLSRDHFVNHMPDVLDTLCVKLRAWPTPVSNVEQAEFPKGRESHSRHRWQWGYDLPTLVNEWGHLNACLVQLVNRYASDHAEFGSDALTVADQCVSELLRESLTENVSDYTALLQLEAATRVKELQATLVQVRDMEQARGELLRAATHDLRGSLGIVTGSVALMQDDGAGRASDDVTRLQRGVHGLHEMLTKLMDMSRLEAGQEKRDVVSFDAAQLLNELCSSSQGLARSRGLQLQTSGPASLPVLGDKVKVQRIAQNLLLNSLKYTQQGNVTVRWGPHEVERWAVVITDTGPGFDPHSPLIENLQLVDEPTHAPELTEGNAARRDVDQPPGAVPASGEGVGLAIVKRLCELLDAALDLETVPGRGTSFRVVFPVSYS